MAVSPVSLNLRLDADADGGITATEFEVPSQPLSTSWHGSNRIIRRFFLLRISWTPPLKRLVMSSEPPRLLKSCQRRQRNQCNWVFVSSPGNASVLQSRLHYKIRRLSVCLTLWRSVWKMPGIYSGLWTVILGNDTAEFAFPRCEFRICLFCCDFRSYDWLARPVPEPKETGECDKSGNLPSRFRGWCIAFWGWRFSCGTTGVHWWQRDCMYRGRWGRLEGFFVAGFGKSYQ